MASRGSGLLKLSLSAPKTPGLTSRSFSVPFSPILSRCLSTSSSLRPASAVPPFRLERIYPSARTSVWSTIQKRFATGSSSHNLLAHMEQTANNNPGSATAQNALYAALLRANMPAIVVERYQTGRYATNAACQATYIKALERLGGGGADNAGALAGYGHSHSQASSPNMSGDTLQGIAQAIAARSNGGNSAMSSRMSGAAGEQGSKKAPIYVVTDESWGQVIFKWVKMLLTFGLMTYVILVAIHLLIDTTGVLKRATGVGNIEATTQKARFSDVQGCDEAKEELQELVEFLKEPERFARLGGKLPKGVLLTGPPGTGKTLLARAVAGEAGVPFFYMAGSEFDEIYVGVGAKRIRELFTQARAKSPAIIFIDELDAVGGKRSEKEASYHKQTLNQLLTELDGFEEDTGVIIIGATNFPNALDKALTRPGRFDRNVVVPLPDVRGRMKILEFYFKKITVADGVDSSIIARKTMGFSGADLENLVNQAAVRASKNKQLNVQLKDLDWAMDKIMMGAERRSAVMQDKDKLMTAYHEAGHALVGLFTPGAMEVYKATIMPRGQALGVTHFLPELDAVSVSRTQLRARIDVSMGGKVAEEIIYGVDGVTSGASSDIEGATEMAHAMVTAYGMSDKVGDINLAWNGVSTETRHVIEQEIMEIIKQARIRATKLLTEKRKELDLLAQGLVKYEVLDLEEIKKVIAGEDLPEKMTSDPSGNVKLPELAVPPALPGPASLPTPGAHTPLPGQTGKADRRSDDSTRGEHRKD